MWKSTRPRFTATGSVIRGPDPVVITQLTKDPLIAGTYSLRFQTKTSGYWSFTLGFDYGGLKLSVDSFLNYQGTTLPILAAGRLPGTVGSTSRRPLTKSGG
jgi:hypothetical protein